MSGKTNGIVKWFNDQKGYGFITPDGGGSDVFVHVSALGQSGIDTLNEGDKVEFDVEVGRKAGKTQAANVRVV